MRLSFSRKRESIWSDCASIPGAALTHHTLIVCSITLLILAAPERGDSAVWRFVPRQRLFQPLRADPGEPRLGLFTHLNKNRLEGQIGGTFEAFSVELNDARQTTIQFGMHTGVFALLRKTGVTYPLDTADFLIATHTDIQRGRLTGRFEFGHLSAHIADGYRDPVRKPITYSREFFTLYGAYQLPHLRLYSSVRYVNHAIPDVLRWRLQAGGEVESGRLFGHVPRAYIAYDVRVMKDRTVFATHTAQAGVSFHTAEHAGLRIAIIAHTGHSEHGQFHDLTDRFVAAGFFFDL